MFQARPWPNVILHLDGDAFFASVIQSVNPQLKGKPVVVGRKRGIATAVSYEAKSKYSIPRGMPVYQIKKKFPQCVVVDSNYQLFQLFSRKMFNLMRQFSPQVEEYSVDEGFADLKGLQRPLKMNYTQIARALKDKIEDSLNLTVSVGLSTTKSLAKLASSANKPAGLTVVSGRQIGNLLRNTSTEEIWGIGPNISAHLQKLGIRSALELAKKPEEFIVRHFHKPLLEIWHELRGKKIYQLNLQEKTSYQSITRSKTFTPPTSDADILWSKVVGHVERAFQRARELDYRVGEALIFLKTQDYHYHQTKIKLREKTRYPLLFKSKLREAFEEIHLSQTLYRSAGCTISQLDRNKHHQTCLLSDHPMGLERTKKVYALYDQDKIDFATKLWDQPSPPDSSDPHHFTIPVLFK